MGSACFHSATRNTAIRTTAPVNSPTISVLDHPSSLPRMRARIRRKRETEKETNPIQSIRRSLGSFDSLILVRVMMTATTPTGTLMKKIHRHPIPLVMAPPTNGPTATAPPRTAP